MGDNVTIGESLIVTLFSMLVVFAVLFIISYLIRILKISANGKKKADAVYHSKQDIADEKPIENKEEKMLEDVKDEELVAVIAAAVAANLGVSIPEVNIKSIRRVPQNNPVWSDMGRREQILDRL